MANFESLLTREVLRRDAAMLRMRTSCTATRAVVQRETEGIKRDVTRDINRIKDELTPQSIVQHKPWGSVLSAIAVGLGAGMILKSLFGRKSHVEYRNGPPQRVVVQVEGAKEVKTSGPAGAAAHPWKAILDAAMHGIPALMAFAEQHLHSPAAKNGNGNGHVSVTSEDSEPIAAAPSNPSVESGPFKTSISRRSAPPPRES